MSHSTLSTPKQSDFLAIPGGPLCHWLSPALLKLLATGKPIRSIADVNDGLTTGDNERTLRFFWEFIHNNTRWFRYAKAGHYCKWAGLDFIVVDWQYAGARIRNSPRSFIRNERRFFTTGVTYNLMSRGAMNARILQQSAFDPTSITIFLTGSNPQTILSLLNTRITSYLLRVVAQGVKFNGGYVSNHPLPSIITNLSLVVVDICITLKHHLVGTDPTERSFSVVVADQGALEAIASLLHTLEGINEREVFAAYEVSGDDMQAVLDETGIPAGFHPLITGYDALPALPADLDLPPLPQEVIDHLAAHERISPTPAELARIKVRLRALYEAGPGAKEDEEAAESDGGDDGEGAVSGAHIPIPTETFLEELAVKMQLHPISVYWLLEELRREGARCKPEERRLLEDRLSVLVLRLLGHRWPKQIEAGEPVPDWADADGIIPITGGTSDTTLAERVRARLRVEDGDLGVQRSEALLQELTGLPLEEWLRREFFKRHVRQFKYRPIAWHLVSKPVAPERTAGRRSSVAGRRQPAFECLLSYHACGGDVLARLRTQYVEPLLRAERQHLEAAHRREDETAQAQSTARIQELEAFVASLRDVAERGFACPELQGDHGGDHGGSSLRGEPLDRWNGDGYIAPASHDDLLHQERAWRVDLNDGVRVNIAPVQLAGLLASDVLKTIDAKKAIADRVRWRSDERRWVRDGKLPRPGWMPDAIPESPKWTELAPQREAERVKLEQKRRAVAERGETPV